MDKPLPRKLAVILYADVVEYSRLTGNDEDATHRVLGEYLDLITQNIESHRGKVTHYAGDAVLAKFEAVVDALTSACDIQRQLAKLNRSIPIERQVNFRIGVNLGDVIEDRGDIYGDGVNIAARLEGLADPGGICISGAVYDQVHNKLDLAFEDIGKQEVKNITHAVQTYRVRPKAASATEENYTQIPQQRRNRKRAVFALIGLVFMGLFGGVWFHVYWNAPGLDESKGTTAISIKNIRPAIVVLPFANMSGEPEQEYFSDAFTEDLTTGLARIPGFLVVARNTAFTYKGKNVDARDLKRDLGVRYLLEGSARQGNGRLRINVQLIETATGTHVWAERFDRPMKDIFIVQDALVDRIIGTVAANLRRHEGERSMLASEETLAAYDLTARARLLFRRNTLEALTEARNNLYRANEIDPEYSPAFSLLAQVENFFFTSRLSDEYAQPEAAKRVLDAAARAVVLAPDNAFVHAVYGMSLRLKNDYEGAAQEARNALELAPNDPEVLAPVSVILLSVGEYQDSVETVQLARVLDRNLSPIYVGGILAQGLFALGDFNGSKVAAQDCLAKTPNDVRCLESLVRALGELGAVDEAQKAVDELLRLSPNFTVSEYIRRANKNRLDKSAIQRWADGLRKSGIPE